MTAWLWVHVLAAVSGLVLVALAVRKGAASPLARPLSLLAIDQFVFNAGSVGTELSGNPSWSWLGAVASPLFTPLGFDFVLTFLGKRRRALRWLYACYALFGAQALLVAVDMLTAFDLPGGLNTYAVLLLVPSLPFVGTSLVLVAQHARATGDELERLRARLLMLALALVTLSVVTDPLADLGLPVPRLSTLGSFTFNVLLTQLTLGMGLLPGAGAGTRRWALAQALTLGLLLAVVMLALLASLGARQSVLLVAVTGLSLAVAAVGWLVLSTSHRARVGLERFATLGRFSAQMAHDLKNPLAAARGAAEYLVEELKRGGGGPNEEFARLLVQQLDRLGAVIERYQRLSKLEPQRAPLDLNELVTRVLSLQAFAAPAGVTVTAALATPAPRLEADGDLLASALENLVKNALEATPPGGTVTVRTRLDAERGAATLAVQDTGHGLDARAREQAFALFFTTRAQGSGLGLAFVRQVARAHGGDAELASEQGLGTTVTLTLPTEPDASVPAHD